MEVPVNEIISTCMSLGLFVSINQRLDAEMQHLRSGKDEEVVSPLHTSSSSSRDEPSSSEDDSFHRRNVSAAVRLIDDRYVKRGMQRLTR